MYGGEQNLPRAPGAEPRPVPPALIPAVLDIAATPTTPGTRWHQVTTAARPELDFTRTHGTAVSAATAIQASVQWTSPAVQPMDVPGVLVPRTPETRYTPARSRAKKLLDRLCGLDSAHAPPRTLVVVAHPDDEAIGVGARLATVPDAMIVHVTDGAPRDPAYSISRGFPTREAYAMSRQHELADALALIGIAPERSRCLGIVDGEASDRLVDITYRLVSLFDEFQPEVALTHPYEGGHTDHDATAFAVHLACGVLRREGGVAPVVMEMTSYHLRDGVRRVGEFLPFGELEERTIELDETAQALKRRVYDCFASQTSCLSSFRHDRERFRAAPRYSFTRPPHAGPLLYERGSKGLKGRQWRANAARALEHLRYRKQQFAVS